MLIRQLKITNASGESIEFGRHFRLYEGFNLSDLKANVNYSDSTSDGANHQRTLLDVRDIDIPFFIKRIVEGPEWIEEKRQEAYRVFNPKKNPMKLEFTTKGDESFYLHANIEGAPSFPSGLDNSNGVWQKGLLQFSCGDPFVYRKEAVVVQIATWIPTFEFALEISEGDGIEMGYRAPSLIANAYNDGHEETGMIIRFKALGTLVNPSLINVNTYEEFKLNMTMEGGDVVEVSTYKRNKYVHLTRNNVTTDIFSKFDIMSEFLQLQTGDNLFRYNADDGIDNLEVSMNFTPKLLGV